MPDSGSPQRIPPGIAVELGSGGALEGQVVLFSSPISLGGIGGGGGTMV